jgi:hypothetical protein
MLIQPEIRVLRGAPRQIQPALTVALSLQLSDAEAGLWHHQDLERKRRSSHNDAITRRAIRVRLA